MEHTALLQAARDLRKRLESLPTAALIMAPGLKTAVPLVYAVVQGVEDLADRMHLVEQRVALLEGVGGSLQSFNPTITEPGVMPTLDYDLDALG